MRSVRVAIVGAGLGGICAALKLRAAGHRDIVIYEQAADIGGTWFSATYPGAACDAPSHLYSYSFAQDVAWSRRFAPGPEIHAYIQRCVQQGGIAEAIHTTTTVVAARWTGQNWLIQLADGREDHADVLVPAVGQLSVPALPALRGLDDFGGSSFHTAGWRHDVSLRAKRVAVVGTGASAIQVIPAIAQQVEHLIVFQRSAPYVLKKPDGPYSDRLHRRYRAVPALRTAARQLIWAYLEMVTVAFDRWPAALRALERSHARTLSAEIADPALRAKLRPHYRAGCKRILMSNDYYPALARDNVTVVTDPIDTVTEIGIATACGEHAVDVIIFATGFLTSPFLASLPLYGRRGISLSDRWSDREAAYLGISVPDFPNMFLMYGPNTNLGSGSIIYMLEAQATHIVAAVNLIAAAPCRTVEIRERAYREFVRAVAHREGRTVWAGCRSWYQDASGRNTHNWPWLSSTYRRRTRRLRRSDYLIAP